MYRRTLMTLAAALMGTTLLGAGAATAQEYPDRPIQMIVPWGAGGGTDGIVRKITNLAENEIGDASMYVENVEGGVSATGIGHSVLLVARLEFGAGVEQVSG